MLSPAKIIKIFNDVGIQCDENGRFTFDWDNAPFSGLFILSEREKNMISPVFDNLPDNDWWKISTIGGQIGMVDPVDTIEDYFMALYENNAAPKAKTSAKTTAQTKTTVKPKSSNKKARINQALRRAVWNGSNKCCNVCKKTLEEGDFECGHIIAESEGGPTTLSNLTVLCNKCNKSIGTENVNDFKKRYGIV